MTDPFGDRDSISAEEYRRYLEAQQSIAYGTYPPPPAAPDWRTNESAFRAKVVKEAEARGWRVAWTWSSQHSPKGWPDLVLCRPPRFEVAELKLVTGRVSQAQKIWLEELADCGIAAHLWTPDDWDQIERILR